MNDFLNNDKVEIPENLPYKLNQLLFLNMELDSLLDKFSSLMTKQDILLGSNGTSIPNSFSELTNELHRNGTDIQFLIKTQIGWISDYINIGNKYLLPNEKEVV